jgi:hypothetical protein
VVASVRAPQRDAPPEKCALLRLAQTDSDTPAVALQENPASHSVPGEAEDQAEIGPKACRLGTCPEPHLPSCDGLPGDKQDHAQSDHYKRRSRYV